MHCLDYNRAALLISVCLMLINGPMFAVASELTSDERAAAHRISQALPWTAPTRSKAGQHALGIQTLSIEADWKKHNNAARLARVYQFNHDTQQGRLLVVDLDTQQTDEEQKINSVHLPLSDDEVTYAHSLLASADPVLAALTSEQPDSTLSPHEMLDKYDVKASIYEPLQSPHACKKQRCVLFALVDQSLTVSSVEPLVNLATGDVQLLQSTLK